MTMARSIGGRPLRRASAAGTRRAGRVHEDGRDCGNPAAGPSTDRGGGARSKWPGRGTCSLVREIGISPAPPHHHLISLASLGRLFLAWLRAHPTLLAAGCWLLPSALPCVAATWTAVTPVYMPAWSWTGPDQLPGTGREGITGRRAAAALDSWTVHCTAHWSLEIDRWITVVGLTGPGRRPGREEHTPW